MKEAEKPKEFMKWILILIICLLLLTWKAINHWPVVILMASVSLFVVFIFIYWSDENFFRKVTDLFKEQPKIATVPFMAYQSTNYTQSDLAAFRKENQKSSQNQPEEEFQRPSSGYRPEILIDNSHRMNNFYRYTQEPGEVELEEPSLHKEFSFGTSDFQTQKDPRRPKTKTVTFQVGAQAKKDIDDADFMVPFTDRDPSYRKRSVEALAEYIHTGIMNYERLMKEHKVEYTEPRPIATIAPPVPTQPKQTAEKSSIPAGLLDLKNKQEKDNILLTQAARGDKTSSGDSDKQKISLFKPNGTNLSTIVEVQEEGMLEKSRISAQIGPSSEQKPLSTKPATKLFDSMAIEQIEEKSPLPADSKAIVPETSTSGSLMGIFGQPPKGLSPIPPLQPVKPVPATSIGPSGPLQLKNPSETISKNKELYFSVATHVKDMLKNPHKVSDQRQKENKEIVRNFLRDICSIVDDHFLKQCENIIYELNARKNNEDEYLAFCYELVTMFILEFIDLMSSNKIKIVSSSYEDLCWSHLPDHFYISLVSD